MNVFMGVGTLVQDPELRYTSGGKAVVSIRLAFQTPFKDADGKYQATFLNAEAWGQTAEYITNHLVKGDKMTVRGVMRQKSYTTRDGANRTEFFVGLDQVIGHPKSQAARPQHHSADASKMTVHPGHLGGLTADDEYDPFLDE
jgi:single-strand DNA-binding protein